jgi:ABC-type multidrug transport system ATPase subunit/pSer/pThr/pTyr-binding forkhead associated (FHA) protein
MKIVLIEEQAGQNAPDLTFQQELIKIGRDAAECQISFAREKYPMVSRQHAEIRHHNNNWILVDKNSSYGTFLNGRKVVQPEQIQVGSTIQIGVDGPNLIVIHLEVGGVSQPVGNLPQSSPEKDIKTAVPGMQTPPVQPILQTSQNKPQNIPSPTPINKPVPPTPVTKDLLSSLPGSQASSGEPQLEFVGKNDKPPFKVVKPQIWLGRDKGCDIILDSKAAMVSRKHAEISRQGNGFIISDNKSFNGTLVNKQRISSPTPLYHGDEIQLGMGGPILRFNLPQQVAPKGASMPGQRAVAADQSVVLQNAFVETGDSGPKTMVYRGDVVEKLIPEKKGKAELLMSLTFGGKSELIIGRSDNNDISLDGLGISNRHARLLQSGNGVVVEDLNSTNGVFLNGKRVSRQTIAAGDAVQIGSFEIKVDLQGVIGVFDTRSKTRIDCVKVSQTVKNRAGGGMITLLDDVSLSIQPNEFVGLLGPSGAGKSTLMDALNGMRPASGGSVLINDLDLYENLDSFKQSIGYVPQEDIIHRELSVYKTLYYVAKLRLSGDVSGDEIDQIIDEVLDVTGLTERKDVAVSQLSGGQRKRVSIAVELITKPSIIFLDEPTSGLDPATEEKIMRLFRQIAESGRTVILTTHAMENIRLFDKIVILMRGKLVFYGKPEEALSYIGVKSFKELYDKLEEPIEEAVRKYGEEKCIEITEKVAEDWKQKFLKTPQYKENVFEPLKKVGAAQSQGIQKKRRLGIFGSIRQFFTLSRRYLEVLFKDKLNLFILFAQAPIVALLTLIVINPKGPRDFVYFVLSLVSVWFGTSVAAREIIRERPVFKRERMVNLGLMPYLFSKLFILGIIVGFQCFLLFIPLKFFDLVGLMKMPGELFGIPQLWTMLLTAGVGLATGLFVSAIVKTSEMATSLVPLILIPQILFSGLVGVPNSVSRVVSLTMPSAWSFDTMKRVSGLDTLEKEGSDPKGKNEGLGLYKFIEKKNDDLIEETKAEVEQYKKDADVRIIRDIQNSRTPNLDDPPKPKDPIKIPPDLSDYVNFLNDWMGVILNQIILVIMFYLLVVATLIILRIQDIV